ncbi:hypothetical protein BD414DRAFT_69046 [Trametes punicea]|nr:hypothetical protein BD414DRAFT_69046 [Trametes punicea]
MKGRIFHSPVNMANCRRPLPFTPTATFLKPFILNIYFQNIEIVQADPSTVTERRMIHPPGACATGQRQQRRATMKAQVNIRARVAYGKGGIYNIARA